MSRNKIQRIILVGTLCVNRAVAPVSGFPGFTTGYYADGTCIKCTDSAVRHGQKKDAESAPGVNGSNLRATGRQIVFVYLFFRVKPPASVEICGALDIERAGIYAKSDTACKFVNMEILKRSAMQISRANYARDERATQNYKLP